VSEEGAAVEVRKPRVFMMDLWAIVPYYTAYLSKALLREGVNLQVGSITYYLDTKCFSSRGIKNDPGLVDIVGRFNLPRLLRRVLKAVEAMINLGALVVRFSISAPEIVHVQYLPMLTQRIPLDFWFLEFCTRKGSRVVLTVHDLLPHDSADIHKRTFQKLYRMVDVIICHSDHIRTRLRGEFEVDEDKISVIPHGPFFYDIPTGDVAQFFIEEEPTSVIVLWQGIIFPYKGIDLLLDAWRGVEKSGTAARLVIAGTGSPEILAAIQEQIAQLELKRVTLQLRFISSEELVAVYRRADIVVYPYRAITTSGALATGLALGKTIVASDLTVFRELLTNEENALLVNPEKTEELAAVLIRLIGSAELREEFAAKIRAMNFGDASWISIAKKTMDTYESILTKPV
jgi:glycosyltransferase involved in cell wall biosynthesis